MPQATSRNATAPARSRSLRGRVGAALFWVAVWQLASMVVDSEFILAGPLDALQALVRLIPTPDFWGEVWFSFARIALGTILGYVLAIALAAGAHASQAVRTLIAPALSAIKGTPVACVVVVLLIWFGSRNVSAIAVFLMALPGVYFPVLKGLDQLDCGMRELFWVHRADRRHRLLAFALPGVLPYLTAASATVLPMSWKAGVAAELIGVPDGSIGERIYQAKLLLETADLFAWTIVVVVVAWAFERALLAGMRALWPAAGRRAAALAGRHAGDEATGMRLAPHTQLIEAHAVRVGHGEMPVAGPFSFSLDTGETLCLMGASGAGKTTLLMTVAGLLDPVEGSLSASSGQGRTARVSMVFQDTRLVDDLTAVENVQLFADPNANARGLLAELLPDDALDTPVRELSGGQRRRVELVRAFAAPGEVVLLDEPFTGLDANTHRCALAFVRAHQGQRAVIVSTHDADDAKALGGRVLSVGPIPAN